MKMTNGHDPSHGSTDIYLQTTQDGESYALSGSSIIVHTTSKYTAVRDSCKVKSLQLVNNAWETRTYHGKLIAVHKDGLFFAYTLQNNLVSAVRVCHRAIKTRSLIKGFSGRAVDIDWAFTADPHHFAILDESAELWIYEITTSKADLDGVETFSTKTVLRLQRENPPPSRLSHRLTWCPYVPEDLSDDSDTDRQQSLSLAVTHDDMVELVRVGAILSYQKLEDDKRLLFSAVDHGLTTIRECTNVTTVTLSPDGTALALGTSDGSVKFYMTSEADDGEMKCAHQWNPHDDRPVQSLLFLDDMKGYTPESQFWRFAVTAADGNRELKLWSCEDWTCMQTLTIKPPVSSFDLNPEHVNLQLVKDQTSQFLFLSDLQRKSLYVMELEVTESSARYVSFTELPLCQPALSLAVIASGRHRFRPFSPGAMGEENGDFEDEEQKKQPGVRALLYAVNPKSLLELEIRFQPPTMADLPDRERISSISTSNFSFRDNLSDMNASALTASEQSVVSTSLDAPAKDALPMANSGAAHSLLLSPHDLGSKDAVDLSSYERGEMTPTAADNGVAVPEISVSSSRGRSGSPADEEVRKIMKSHSHRHEPDPPGEEGEECQDGEPDLPDEEEDDEFLHPRPSTPLARELDELNGDEAASMMVNIDESDEQSAQNQALAEGELDVEIEEKEHNTHQQQPDGQDDDEESPMMEGFDGVLVQFQQAAVDLTNAANQLSTLSVAQPPESENIVRAIDDLRQLVERYHEDLLARAPPPRSSPTPPRVGSALAQSSGDALELAAARARAEVLGNTVQGSVDKFCREELNPAATKAIEKTLNTLGATIQVDIGTKLAATDALLKENIQKMVKSKPVLDTIGRSAASAISNEIRTSCRDTFSTQVLPSLETSQKALFVQLDATFKGGISEHLDTLKAQSSSLQKSNQQSVDAIKKLLKAQEEQQQQLEAAMDKKLDGIKAALSQEIRESIVKSQESLLAKLTSSLKHDLDVMAREQSQLLTQSLRSAQPTPVPTQNELKTRVGELLDSKQYQTAFETALSVSDLDLVMWTCQRVNPSPLFNPKPQLNAPTILSLIQQLTVNFAQGTEVKLRYLEEALLAVNPRDVQTGQHVPKVLRALLAAVGQLLQTHPQSPHAKSLKMLSMAAQGLLTEK